MGRLNSFTQVNYFPGSNIMYSVLGYGTLGLSLAGTFSAGTLQVQGSNDGRTWMALTVFTSGSTASGTTISAVGNYNVGLVSFTLARLVPTGFSGNLTVTASISTEIL